MQSLLSTSQKFWACWLEVEIDCKLHGNHLLVTMQVSVEMTTVILLAYV